MKTTIISTSLVCFAALVLVAAPAVAEIGTLDQVPAATLLLPYFEVSLGDVSNQTANSTTFTIANSSASAAVAHVTLWTDLGIPTYSFDVYLTGFDVELVNLRLLFNGIPPVTADDESDPGDTSSPSTGISNQGVISQDINFSGATGPCGGAGTLYHRLSVAEVTALRSAHTGQASALLGGQCGATDRGDNMARGFVTIDTVNSCTTLLPSDPGYGGVIGFRNILFGEYWVVSADLNFAHGEPLVAIEASLTDPRTDGAGDYTFYGRLNSGSGADHREGLPTVWMGRYLNGGAFDGGTTAFVWRDAWPGATFACGVPIVGLSQLGLLAFDEEENLDYLPIHQYFPLAAQRVGLGDPTSIPLEYSFGFLYYDLKRGTPTAVFGTTGQSYVTHAFSATGRFEGAYAVWPLDNVSEPLESYFFAYVPQCINGVDDDLDGFTDFPADPSCQSEDFPSENPQCNDGEDNDGDGFTDLDDPQCTGVFDLSEYS